MPSAAPDDRCDHGVMGSRWCVEQGTATVFRGAKADIDDRGEADLADAQTKLKMLRAGGKTVDRGGRSIRRPGSLPPPEVAGHGVVPPGADVDELTAKLGLQDQYKMAVGAQRSEAVTD